MSRNLGNWLKAYMEFTGETESPAAYHYWTACTLISAATKRQVYLDFNMFKIYPNLYTILVGPSGARKSAATQVGIEFAKRVGIRKFSDKITGAALIRDLSAAVEKTITPLNGGGGEVELTSPVMIYASELGVFLGHDAYGSGVIADLTDLYDCPSNWEKKTISRDAETVNAPYVTLLAASTPQTLKDTLPAGAVGQGFTSRVLFVWGDGRRRRVPIPEWSAGHEMLRNNLVDDLKKIMTIRGAFSFSEDGLALYKKHYHERPSPEEEYEDERLRNYASRKDIHLLKVAQICSLSRKDELVLTAYDIQTAIDVIKWLDDGLANVFAGHGTATHSQDVIRVFRQVQTAKGGAASYPDLLKRNYSYLNIQEFSYVLQTLVDSNAVSETVGVDPVSGKMAKIFKVLDQNFIARWNGATVPEKVR